MNAEKKALQLFNKWYAGLKVYRASGGPAKGTIAVGLILLDKLKTTYIVDLKLHQALGKAQIKGAGPTALRRVLAEFGERREFLREGGRTNRGGPGEIERMLKALAAAELEKLPADKRNQVLTKMQQFLVDRVRDYHGRQRLKITHDPSRTTWQTIHELLSSARTEGKEAAVAQYLVGAKLQLRFPNETIENKSFSTADQQLGRQGDYQVRDTCFHITVSPSQGHFDRCVGNLEAGLRVYLLVPERVVVAAKQSAEQFAAGKITVLAIESFVSQNLEELATFTTPQLSESLKALLEAYNNRVDQADSDKSLLVEIPLGLK